ncbi:MAG: hypothetical protein JNN15_18250 [Blastocatellia bacterium]|nr:hypothetical protein [Blastocatellia bacterium]
MIAPPNSTSETMLRAVAYTIAALNAATAIDIEATPDEKAFFTAKKEELQKLLEKLLEANEALNKYTLTETVSLQASVQLGDKVLEKGIRTAKARIKLELENIKDDAADFVFGSNLSSLLEEELRKKPAAVAKAVLKIDSIPDFPGKEKLKNQLEERIKQQEQALLDRDQGEQARAKLTTNLAVEISASSEALYKLEKELLGLFPRERAYVKQFFYDVAPNRKSKARQPPPSST